MHVEPSAFLGKYFPQRDDMLKFEDERKKALKLVGLLGGRNKETENGKVEKDMYQPTVNALKDFCPAFNVEITGGSANDKVAVHLSERLKPDITLYGKDLDGRQRTDLMAMETHKLDEDSDGFDNDHLTSEGTTPFLRNSQEARWTRSQPASYAGSQLASQFRTHTFSVWATGRYARLLCWDRGGVVISTKFDYTRESYLVDFFWCLSHVDREARGYDKSVTVADESNAPHVENAKRALGLDQSAMIYKFKVHDMKTDTDKFYHGVNLIARSIVYPVGRCAGGFEVVDENGNSVYLDDTRRIFANGYEKEGDAKGIGRMVPTAVAHGDVEGRWQKTDGHVWCGRELHEQFTAHQHCFIVLIKKVVRPLSDFRTTRELVTALRDALQAHTEAYRQGILHRDISIGNILISENGGGLLIDWDFSKPIANPDVRIMVRTGIRQFMSVHLLSNPPGTVEHAVIDDLESFFHVLCYVVLVHCPHKFPRRLLKGHLKMIYDSWPLEGEEDDEEDQDDEDEDDDGEQDNKDNIGGQWKILALISLFMANQVQLRRGPLRDLITALEYVMAVRYRGNPTDIERANYQALLDRNLSHLLETHPVRRYDEAVKKLSQSSKWMLEMFNKALEDPRGLKAKPKRRVFRSTNRNGFTTPPR